MEPEQTYLVEILTAQEGKADEAKQLLLRAAQLCGRVPGINRSWIVQDQQNSCEIALVLIGDAGRFPGAVREMAEAEWHKAMALQGRELTIPERKRVVWGPALF